MNILFCRSACRTSQWLHNPRPTCCSSETSGDFTVCHNPVKRETFEFCWSINAVGYCQRLRILINSVTETCAIYWCGKDRWYGLGSKYPHILHQFHQEGIYKVLVPVWRCNYRGIYISALKFTTTHSDLLTPHGTLAQGGTSRHQAITCSIGDRSPVAFYW